MVRTDEHVFSFLTWWEHMPGRQKSEFCRKLLLDLSPKGIIDDKALHLIIHCARAVQKSTLSSAQEHELLQTLKNMIHRCPDYRWPQKTANEKGSHRPSPPRSKEITTLYGWQHEALQAWLDNGSMGIIKAVTGSGKTMVALMAIRRSLAEGGRAVILVPTCALLGQWKKVLKEQLQLGDEQIGCAGGGNRCHPSRQAVTIWVMNSARTSLAGALEHVPPSVPILLVVDECHRAGSKKNAHIFESRYDAAMGLSATPERVGDPGYEQVLLPALGRQVYSYSFARALRERIIPPFDLINIGIDFSPWERQEYEEKSREILYKLKMLLNRYWGLRWPLCRHYHTRGCAGRFSELAQLCPVCTHYDRSDDLEESPLLFKFLYYIAEYLKDPLARQIIMLIINRKSFVNDARQRSGAALSLLEHTPCNTKTLVFSERIALAEEIAAGLTRSRSDIRCSVYHSRIPEDERKMTLHEFRTGKLDLLISCHALDEGLDVPTASMGIIVSGANSLRQRIQRLGRILRAHPEKKKSIIFNFYVKQTIERQLMFMEFEQDEMNEGGVYDMDISGMVSFLKEYFP